MKKIILVLLVVLPVLGFGQDGIKITDNMLLNNKGTVKIPLIKDPYHIPQAPIKLIIHPRIPIEERISPLIVLNGIIMEESFDLNEISVNDIYAIKVYKDEQATALFGTQGKNGVIWISTIPPIEYETIVFAPGYETFLASQKSKDFYSKSYLKTKNLLMVSEWNYRCNNPSIYNPKIYEASIDYEANTNYGLNVEYELYMFFRFMEKENNISLIGDKIS
ncbi:hypothetical protein GGR21_003318 [Dysgonomonas hofstadii]|uniref:TonB-dependent receptor plug domain-containing protein n=1 Tax=Dysgonomonas hofstadii TaxID=637886 RepID=A0A840CQS7_9BACT|nr:DUF6146 family protein [Dysgonomonas hofstadii]MBB4037401.1 hypothetical protein [Dysgonomonas hofstadii]